MKGSSGKEKAKVENYMYEDMQDPLPSNEVSKNGSTVSCFTGENTPQVIHQPTDHVGLANPHRRASQPSNLLSNGHTFPVLDTSAIFFANMAKNGNFNFEGTMEEGFDKGKAMAEDMQELENESVLVEDSSSFTGENTPLLIHQPSNHDVPLVNSSGQNATESISLSLTNPLPRVIRVDHGETSRNNRRFSPYLTCTHCRRGFRTIQGLSRHELTHNQPKVQRPPPSNLSFPVLDTTAMFFANMVKNGNNILQGFGAPNGGLNSKGMVDCTYLDALTRVVTNSCFPYVGFKGASISSDVVGNYFESSQDEGEVRGEDGTIDFLSSVGMRCL